MEFKKNTYDEKLEVLTPHFQVRELQIVNVVVGLFGNYV